MTNAPMVTFEADGALYAAPVSRVREILDLQPISPLPNAPNYLLGITDLRGDNIPVVDLRVLLGRQKADDSPQTRILVATLSHRETVAVIGIRTDRVIEVTQLDSEELKPVTESELLHWSGKVIAGVGRRSGAVVTVLDLDNLFSSVPQLAISGLRPGSLGEPEDERAA